MYFMLWIDMASLFEYGSYSCKLGSAQHKISHL